MVDNFQYFVTKVMGLPSLFFLDLQFWGKLVAMNKNTQAALWEVHVEGTKATCQQSVIHEGL